MSLLQTTCSCDHVVPYIQEAVDQRQPASAKTQHIAQAVTMAHVNHLWIRQRVTVQNGRPHSVLTSASLTHGPLGVNFLRHWRLSRATLSVFSTEEWKRCSSSLQPFLSSPCPSGPLLLPILTLAHEKVRACQPRTPAVCALIRLSVSSLETPVVAKVLRSACHSIITTRISHRSHHHLPSLSS